MTAPPFKQRPFTPIIAILLALAGFVLYWKKVTGEEFGYWVLLFLAIVGLAGIIIGVRYFNRSKFKDMLNKKSSSLGETIYRAILETSPDSFSLTDLTGRFIFCNQQTAIMHGYDTPDELIGISAFNLFPLKEVIRAAKYMQVTRQGGMIKNVEFVLLKKDGSQFHAELSASLIKNDMGIPIAFMAIVRDITERKWVDEQIRESESRYRIVADNTFDWEFWQAPTDRFIYTSPSCKRITGYDAIEFINNSELFINIVHPDDQPKFRLHRTEMKQDKKPGDIEFRILRADSQERWISHICQPVFDGNGAFIGTRGSNRDITERKHAEDGLQLANEQLRLRLAEIEDLHVILQAQALRDPLTGLYNRRYMEDALKKELARAVREGYQISIALLDMDNLKNFNDSYGHAIGDKALTLLSDQLKELTRIDDITCRYGGDEFLVILHKTTLENGFNRVEEWRKAMEEIRIQHEGQELQITFTAGIATYPTHGQTLEEVIKAADDALYRAKDKGRNYIMTPNE